MTEFSNSRNVQEIPAPETLSVEPEWSEADERAVETNRRAPVTLEGQTTTIDSRSTVGPVSPEISSRPVLESVPDRVNPEAAPLFTDSEVKDWRSRWSDVQAEFVDQPRRSVEQAEELVSTVLQRLADSFSTERASLEGQWSKGESVSTEDLRVALKRYRSFFGKLLNAA
jgi:hypothetical protein